MNLQHYVNSIIVPHQQFIAQGREDRASDQALVANRVLADYDSAIGIVHAISFSFTKI